MTTSLDATEGFIAMNAKKIPIESSVVESASHKTLSSEARNGATFELPIADAAFFMNARACIAPPKIRIAEDRLNKTLGTREFIRWALSADLA